MNADYSTDPSPGSAGSPVGRLKSPAAAGASLRSRIAWGLVALLVAAFLARLGLWQLSRAHEKTALAERIAERSVMPPLAAGALARDAATAAAQWERRVVLRGRWLPERTVWLMNRTMDEYNGFFVLTPLRLESGDVVLVQRGFAAGDPASPLKPPPLATPPDEVRVEGHVAPWPAHRIELGRAASGPIRQNLELGAFSAESGLAPRPVIVVEDAAAANAHDGLLRHWAPPAGSAATNYGYAGQWFLMSGTVLALYVWLQFVRRRPPISPDPPVDA
jgi:surfeit locus 1 family protein